MGNTVTLLDNVLEEYQKEDALDSVLDEYGQQQETPIKQYERVKNLVDMNEELPQLNLIELQDYYSEMINPPTQKTAEKFHAPMGVITAYTPTKWQKFKNFFKGEDNLPPNPDRIEKVDAVVQSILGKPLRVGLKFGIGKMLNIPEVMWAGLKRITPEDMWDEEVKNMTLTEAMDWASTYNPSGFEKVVGEVAEFAGRLHTVTPLAQKVGLLGNTPKSISNLEKAGELAKEFAFAAIPEQISKLTAEKIEPTETDYGYEGAKAVLRDFIIGGIFSIAHSGLKGVWKAITPSEEARLLSRLGLKKGASYEEIEKAAIKYTEKKATVYVKGLRQEFAKVVKQRAKFLRGEGDVVFRGQKVKFIPPKLLEGETVAQQTVRLAKIREVPKPAKTIVKTAKTEKEVIVRSGFANIEQVKEVIRKPIDLLYKYAEPQKLAARKFGRPAVTEVMKGTFGKAEASVLDFNNKELEIIDKTYGQLEGWFDNYTQEQQELVMLSRGHGLTGKAREIQVDAFKRLPKELKDSELRRALDEITQFNYDYLVDVVGEKIETLWGTDVINIPPQVRDYHYGIYKNKKRIDKLLDFWATTGRYTKHKRWPTYAEAKAYDPEIKLRDVNPVRNFQTEYRDIARRGSMKQLKDTMMKAGENIYIAPKDNAPFEWEVIGQKGIPEPAFEDVLVEPTMARLINSLISSNKVKQNWLGRSVVGVQNALRTLKFTLSAFHAMNIAKQSVADTDFLGFYKRTSRSGMTLGFKKDDPIFKTPEYREYIELGGGTRYSLERQSIKAIKDMVKQLNKTEQAILSGVTFPVKIPLKFVDWMFENYIPKVKYAKYLDRTLELESKYGRSLKDWEKQEIIKEIQNFYGEMDERLFGRSGTMTTIMRFPMLAPGYAEGNFRTMVKSVGQWGQGEGGWSAARSRTNIPNSLFISGLLATLGTLIATGKLPKQPKTIEEYRDLFKVDTGQKDEYDNPIMIDMLTYDKDYWNVFFNVLRGRPDVAADEVISRFRNMEAPLFQMSVDMVDLARGELLYDWKNDKVFYPEDEFIQKALKVTKHEIDRIEPISVSVFRNARESEIDAVTATLEALTGLRPAKSEREKQEFELIKKLWDMREKKEELSYEIGKMDDPYRVIDSYNKALDKIINAKFVNEDIKAQAESYKIDPKNALNWKRFPVHIMTTKQIEDAITEHTYKKRYKRDDGIWYPAGTPHIGYENRVAELKAELDKRR